MGEKVINEFPWSIRLTILNKRTHEIIIIKAEEHKRKLTRMKRRLHKPDRGGLNRSIIIIDYIHLPKPKNGSYTPNEDMKN